MISFHDSEYSASDAKVREAVVDVPKVTDSAILVMSSLVMCSFGVVHMQWSFSLARSIEAKTWI